MTRELEEQDAMALGALLRGEDAQARDRHAPISDRDGHWLQETATDLMAVVDSRSQSTFPVFRNAEANSGRRGLGARSWVAALAIAACAVGAFTWNVPTEAPSLTFVVESASGAATSNQDVGRVRAPLEEPRTLKFSDGSTLKLAQGGSVRVRETDEFGAEVVVEKGTLQSAVTHREDTSWSVFAGPYEVEVTGTKFSTEWDPESGRLIVLLDEGSVRVIGSDIEDHVALKPGQRFEAGPHQAWTVTAQAQPETKTTAPTVAPKDLPQVPLEEPEAERPAVAPSEPSWTDLLRDGKLDRIMSAAREQGLSSCYASCSVARLRALADAARYSGDVNVAREALTQLRARSPKESARAGYLLGGLAEARGQAADAATWYSGYLRQAPSGAFAAEARAGKMRALHALGRKGEAARAADDYLRAHPNGSSAAAARRILNKK